MTNRWLPALLGAVAVAAAWCAARFPSFAPALWLFLMVAILKLPVSERRLLAPDRFALLLLVLGASFLVTLDHELAVRHSMLAIAAVLLYGLARRAPPDDTVLRVLALGIAATAVVAVVQTTGGFDAARAQLDAIPRALREAASTRLAGGRAFGTSSLPGHFAVLLLSAAPLLLDRLHRCRWPWRLASALGLLGVVTGIALTRSLAVLLVAVVVAAVAVATGLPRRPVLLAVGAMVLGIGALTVGWRSDLGALEPVRLRLVNWRTAVSVFVDNPLLGVGIGGVGQAGLVTPTAEANITPYAHNTYLQLLAELGLAGLPAVALLLASIGGVVRRGLAAHPALTLAVLVVPVHNLVDFSAYQPEILLPWAVLLGTLAGRVTPPPERPLPAWLLLPLLAAGSFTAVAAWRGETAFALATTAPAEERVPAMLAATRWQPWVLTQLLLAADTAMETAQPAPRLAAVDEALAARAWVRPRSASWAHTRALLLLGQEKRGEALVWVREARRRAPLGASLDPLEAACAPRH